jgi:SAM-dependent methyltransferase
LARDPLLYNSISSTYRYTRHEDPRIAARIHDGLGPGARIVDIGAGTGNYEPTNRTVIAIDPSSSMISQRSPGRGIAIQAAAEGLPFVDEAFDVAMASLTLHHWEHVDLGLREMRRVAKRQVIFMFDPNHTEDFWAVNYWPEARNLPSESAPPDLDDIAAILEVADVRTVPVPFDCTDGFGAAFWGRPEAYLEPSVQQGMSWLAQLAPSALQKGTDRLRFDLESGQWDHDYGQLRRLSELDVGYRLVIAGQ